MKKLYICMIVICAFVLQGVASAEDTLKDNIIKQAAANNNDIDPVIKEFIKKGTDPRELVKTCIQLGFEACKVATSALVAGADRQLVIFGALDGGATNEDLNRCEGLGYSYDPPANIDPPKSNPTSSSVPK
ncbi:MAG TPA: hypothetical protein VMB78_08285 [Dissulfurispiraceae bacterium]|nr:hypothetical protein [Dissulfurispiraceae bacterium]